MEPLHPSAYRRNSCRHRSILEIAPGYGRWTEFLLGHCDQLVGVDVAANCTEACRERFADHPRVSFETNDGRSLPMVADGSVDFAFSFDSLVHVEADAIEGYLTELARVLKPDGVAFIHHSNFGTYQRSTRALAPLQPTLDRLPTAARAGLLRGGVYKGAHWRATSMTAARFAEMSVGAGLRCVGQELVNWEGGILLLDAFSVVTRPGITMGRRQPGGEELAVSGRGALGAANPLDLRPTAAPTRSGSAGVTRGRRHRGE